MSRAPAVIGTVLVWVALALVPAYLTSTGVVGTIDDDGNVSGAVFWTWMLGFVLSFGWLYVVDKAAGRSHHWWFFPGAALPWLVDFSAAFTPRAGAVFTTLTVVFAVAVVVFALRGAWVDHGVVQSATVLEVLPNLLHLNFVVNDVYVHRRVLVELTRADGSTYRRTLGMLCEIGTAPSVGDQLSVVVDPQHPDRVALRTS